MTTALTVREVLGWKVATGGFPDAEPRVRDTELATRLGFSRDRKIRELIEKYAASGDLPKIHMRPATGRKRIGANRTEVTYSVNEYWLTEDEALFIAAKSDAPMGNAILKALIAVYRAAERQHGAVAKQNEGYLVKLLLAENSCAWDLMWPADFVHAICKLHGEKWQGGAQPQWLASTYEKIYRTLLGDAGYEAIKSAHEDPRHGDNHHQWLNPAPRERLRFAIPIITSMAEGVGSKEEFWARFDHKFGGKMLQLSFLVPTRKVPKDPS